MRNLGGVTILLIALSVALAAVGCLMGGAVQVAGEEVLYGAKSREYAKLDYALPDEAALTAFIGLTAEEQEAYARAAAEYMSSADESAALDAAVLSEKEKTHMQDVRSLVRLAGSVSKCCITIAAALIVAAAWTGLELKRRGRTALTGAACGLGAVALAGAAALVLLSTQGFASLFYRFHELAFSNDLWLMNPQTDILIRMMPESLFVWAAQEALRRAAGMFGAVIVMLAAVYIAVDGILRRNMLEKK